MLGQHPFYVVGHMDMTKGCPDITNLFPLQVDFYKACDWNKVFVCSAKNNPPNPLVISGTKPNMN